MSPQTGSQPARTTRTGIIHKALEHERQVLQEVYSRGVHRMMRGISDIKDLGDASASANDREVAATCTDMAREQLVLVRRYEERVAAGKILPGVCEDCQGEITSARMRALPYASRCTSCQEMLSA